MIFLKKINLIIGRTICYDVILSLDLFFSILFSNNIVSILFLENHKKQHDGKYSSNLIIQWHRWHWWKLP